MRLQSIFAAARGLAIIMVVLFHADLLLGFREAHWVSFRRVYEVLQFVLMPLFFLLFGLAMARAARQPRPRAALSHHAANYLYLYVLWTIAHVFFSFAIRGDVPASRLPWALMRELLLPDSHLWFLWALVGCLVALSLLIRIRHWLQIAMVIAISVVAHQLDASSYVQMALQNMFFFLFGVHYRAEILRVLEIGPVRGLLISIAAFLVVAWPARLLHATGAPPISQLLGLAGSASALFVSVLLMRSTLQNPLSVIGRSTIQIYLLHWYALILGWQAFNYLGIGTLGKLSPYGAPVVLMIFSITFSLALRQLTKPAAWLYSAPFLIAKLPTTCVDLARGHARSDRRLA